MGFEPVPFWRRVRHALATRVACCHCGRWLPRSTSRRGVFRRKKRWYCDRCGAYLERAPASYFDAFLLVFLIFVFTFPIAAVIEWLFECVGIKGRNVALYAWLLICAVLVILAPASDPKYFVTRCVEQHGQCLSCDYDLNHADHERCPECGTDARAVIDAIQKWRGREQHSG